MGYESQERNGCQIGKKTDKTKKEKDRQEKVKSLLCLFSFNFVPMLGGDSRLELKARV